MKQYAPLFGLLALALVSCVRVEVLDAPWDETPQPVLFAILSPSNPVQVFLGMTNTVNDSVLSQCYPEAALYLRRDQGAWVALIRQPGTNTFSLTHDSLLTIKQGVTYELKAVLGQGLPELTGVTTVPAEAARIASASFVVTDTTVRSTYKGDAVQGRLQVQWNKLDEQEGGCHLTDDTGESFDVVEGQTTCTVRVNDYLLPKAAGSLTLWLTTTDAHLDAYLKTVDLVQSFDNLSGRVITDILNAYAGVLPAFSNIDQGVGLLGSCMQDSFNVKRTNHAND